jgi:hypothetical protein
VDSTVAAGGALGLLVTLTGVLLRVLLKTDDRWERLADAQQERLAALEAERDLWRERYLTVIGHPSAPIPPNDPPEVTP